MKKFLAVFVAVMLLVVTGCGNTKTLTCSTNISGLNQDVVVKYDGEDIKSIEMVMTYSASALSEMGVTSETMDLFVSTMKSSVCDTYNAYEGVSCDVTSPNGGLEVVVKLDYPKLSQEAKDDLSFNYQSYDSLKADLEEQGYTCK